MINNLLKLLNKGGKILIGDVIFETIKEFNNVRSEVGSLWDDEEYYCIVNSSPFRNTAFTLKYTKKTFCSGVIEITQK